MKRIAAVGLMSLLLLFTPALAGAQTYSSFPQITLMPLFPSYYYLPNYYPGNFYGGLPAGYSATGYMSGVGFLPAPSYFYYNPLGDILSQAPIGYLGRVGATTYFQPVPTYGSVGYTNLWWRTYAPPVYGSLYYGGNYIGPPAFTPSVPYYSPFRVGIAPCENWTLYLIFGLPLGYCSGAGSTPPAIGIPGFPFYIYLKTPPSSPSLQVTPPPVTPPETPQPSPSTPSPGSGLE